MPFLVCRHIKTNGIQCNSPAMKKQPFCYFHDSFRKRTRGVRSGTAAQAGRAAERMAPILDRDGNFSVEPQGEYPAEPKIGSYTVNTPIDLGLLEDAESVQVAISAVVNALAGFRMQRQRATALLYGLQLAAQNCRNLPEARADADKMLREVEEHEGEPVASPGLKDTEVWIWDADEDDVSDEDDASDDAEQTL